jgi:SPP1 gp7 family putative phage head morphogenesis protein
MAHTDTVVRNAYSSTFNKARQDLFERNADIIVGYQVSAILDYRTTDFCRLMDGQEFAVDNLPHGWPPWHHKCRTILSPITEFEVDKATYKPDGKLPDGLAAAPGFGGQGPVETKSTAAFRKLAKEKLQTGQWTSANVLKHAPKPKLKLIKPAKAKAAAKKAVAKKAAATKAAEAAVPLPTTKTKATPVVQGKPPPLQQQRSAARKWAKEEVIAHHPDTASIFKDWGGSGYVDIRNYQLGGQRRAGLTAGAQTEQKRRVAALKRALKSAPKFQGTVYRGFRAGTDQRGLKKLQAFINSVEKAQGMRTKAFSLFSYVKSEAEGFAATGSSSWNSVLIEVRASKSGTIIERLVPASYKGEAEVLMPQGARFRLVSKKIIRKAGSYNTKTYHYIFEEV